MNEEALLAGIRAEPDDDLVRLAYADWLDENDRPDEAELIRVQLELAAVGERERRLASWLGDNPHVRHLETREAALTKLALDRTWSVLSGLGCDRPHHQHLPSSTPLRWKRGIVEEVLMTAEAFLANGPELMRRYPIVSLNLSGVGTHLQAVIQSKALAGLRALRFEGGYIPSAHFSALGEAEHLAGLRSLTLARFGLNKRAARALAAAAPLAGLRRIALHGCNLGLKSVGALASSSVLVRLEEVQVRAETSYPAEWLRPLVRAPLGHLRILALNDVRLYGSDLHLLNEAPWLSGLRELDLSFTPIVEDLAPRALAWIDLPALRRLDLSRSQIGCGGARSLAGSASLTGLEDLNLTGCDVRDVGAEGLADSPNFSRLLDLNLRNNPITDQGAEALVASPHLSQEAALQITGSSLSGAVRDALRRRFRAVNFGP